MTALRSLIDRFMPPSQATYEALAARIVAEYATGRSVRFPPLGVHEDGPDLVERVVEHLRIVGGAVPSLYQMEERFAENLRRAFDGAPLSSLVTT